MKNKIKDKIKGKITEFKRFSILFVLIFSQINIAINNPAYAISPSKVKAVSAGVWSAFPFNKGVAYGTEDITSDILYNNLLKAEAYNSALDNQAPQAILNTFRNQAAKSATTNGAKEGSEYVPHFGKLKKVSKKITQWTGMFGKEASMFYLGVGVVQMLSVDNPAALEEHLISLEDPIGHISFAMFFIANRLVTGPLNKAFGDKRFMRGLIPNLGMTAGLMASHMSTELLTYLRNCYKDLKKMKANDNVPDTCNAAWDWAVIKKNIAEQGPGLASMLATAAVMAIPQATLAQRAMDHYIKLDNAINEEGIEKIVKNGLLKNVKLFGINLAIQISSGNPLVRTARFILFDAAPQVANAALFVGLQEIVDEWVKNPLLVYKNSTMDLRDDSEDLRAIYKTASDNLWDVSNQYCNPPKEMSIWDFDLINLFYIPLKYLMCDTTVGQEFSKTLTQFGENLEHWRQIHLEKVIKNHQGWMTEIRNVSSFYMATKAIYLDFLYQVMFYQHPELQTKSLLDRVDLMGGISLSQTKVALKKMNELLDDKAYLKGLSEKYPIFNSKKKSKDKKNKKQKLPNLIDFLKDKKLKLESEDQEKLKAAKDELSKFLADLMNVKGYPQDLYEKVESIWIEMNRDSNANFKNIDNVMHDNPDKFVNKQMVTAEETAVVIDKMIDGTYKLNEEESKNNPNKGIVDSFVDMLKKKELSLSVKDKKFLSELRDQLRSRNKNEVNSALLRIKEKSKGTLGMFGGSGDFKKALEIIQTKLGNPNYFDEIGEGYFVSLSKHSDFGANLDQLDVPFGIGRYVFSRKAEYFLYSMVCGPNLWKSENLITSGEVMQDSLVNMREWHFSDRFNPPMLRDPQDRISDVCSYDVIPSWYMYREPIIAIKGTQKNTYKGLVDYMKNNVNPVFFKYLTDETLAAGVDKSKEAVEKAFNELWDAKVVPEVETAFKRYGEDYSRVKDSFYKTLTFVEDEPSSSLVTNGSYWDFFLDEADTDEKLLKNYANESSFSNNVLKSIADESVFYVSILKDMLDPNNNGIEAFKKQIKEEKAQIKNEKKKVKNKKKKREFDRSLKKLNQDEKSIIQVQKQNKDSMVALENLQEKIFSMLRSFQGIKRVLHKSAFDSDKYYVEFTNSVSNDEIIKASDEFTELIKKNKEFLEKELKSGGADPNIQISIACLDGLSRLAGTISSYVQIFNDVKFENGKINGPKDGQVDPAKLRKSIGKGVN